MSSQSRMVTSDTVPKCPKCRRVATVIGEPMAGTSYYRLKPVADCTREELLGAASGGPMPPDVVWVLATLENVGDHGTGPCCARCECGHEWTFRGLFANLDHWSE